MPVDNLTWEQWFRNIVNTPIDAPKQTLTVTFNGAKNKLVVLKYAIENTTSSSKEADINLALAQGDTEELRDQKGITTEFSNVDLIKNPKGTLKKIIESTRDDIFNVDELTSLKSARIVGNLTRGKTKDEDGRDLDKPSSMILQAMGATFPSLKNASGLHNFQLLVDATPSQPKSTYTDRRAVETGETINPTFRTYEQQATSMHALAENSQSDSARVVFRNQNIQNFNRTSLRELEFDLSKTFDHALAGGKSSTGELTKYVKAHGGLPNPADPNYDTVMGKILGIPPADFANTTKFSEATKRYIHATLDAEVTNIRINGDAFTSKKIADAVNANLGFTPGAYPAGMSPKVQAAWDKFIGANPGTPGAFIPVSAEDRMKNYNNLRLAYISEDGPLAWSRVAVADVGLQIDARKYNGIVRANLFEDDLNFTYQAKLVESYMLYESHAAQIRRDIYNAAVEKRGTNAGRLALERYDAAVNNIRLGNNLFFASTTQQILENLRDNRFMSNAIVMSRFFNTLPFVDPEFRNLKAYTKMIDPMTYAEILQQGRGVKKLGKVLFDDENTPLTKLPANVAAVLGVGFASQELPKRGLMPVAKFFIGEEKLTKLLENREFIFHQKYIPGVNSSGATALIPSGNWQIIGARPNDIAGLFGKNSVFDVLREVNTFNLLDGVMTLNINDFVANPANLQSLQSAIGAVSTAATGYAPLNAFEELAMHLGFGPGGQRQAIAGEFIAKFQTALAPGGGIQWLQGLKNSGQIDGDDLWRLMQNMVASGKSESLVKAKVIGLFNIYNKYANLVNDYIYKNIVWGSGGSWIPGISRLRPFMQNSLGMSDTIGLIQASKTWAWVQRLEMMGKRLYDLASGNAGASVGSLLSRWAGTRLAQSALMQGLAKSLGYILMNAGGVVSGGIGFVLGTVATIAFKASLKILRGDFVGVYYVVKEDVTAFVNVVKKIIIYPLFAIIGSCGCAIFLVIMAISAIPAMFAPYEELVAGVSGVANSEILRVDKSVQSQFFNTFLEFTVTVENISDKPATIARVSDKMTMVGGCTANGSGQVYNVGEAGFVGELRAQDSANTVPISYIEAQFLGRILQPGETFVYKYSIFKPLLPANGDATYYNSIELGAAEEANKSAADNASYVVGSGGCALCPSGYPTRSGYLTQGPATVGPGASHSGSESIDLGVPVGTEVYATHDGVITVTTGYHYGWGNTVEVASPLGFVSWYTHLSAFEVSTGDTVTKGDLIGLSGGDPDTGGAGAGNTSGAHLHYEFRRNASGTYSECNGEPVTMRPPFVPAEVNNYRGAYIAAW